MNVALKMKQNEASLSVLRFLQGIGSFIYKITLFWTRPTAATASIEKYYLGKSVSVVYQY